MTIKARAQQTLTKIFDGSGVFSIILTNENTAIPLSNEGLALNYSATPTDVYVYSGTSLLTPVLSNPSAGQYTLTAAGENITAGTIIINGDHFTVGASSDLISAKDVYSINFTASGNDFLGNPFSSQKKQTITAIKRGNDATSYWENSSSSVITKDVKGNLTPADATVSAVSQTGMGDPTEYKGIFKVYYKTGATFPSTPDYVSSGPESSYKIVPAANVNDIRSELYDATGQNLLDIQTIPVISQANGVISTKIVYTVTSSQVQPTDSANWSDTIPTVGKGQYLWTKTTFYYTDGSNAIAYSMGSNGKDGASAPLLTLTADSQIVTFDSDGSTPIPASQTITLTAILQNLTGMATFVATPYSGTAAGTPITLGGTGNVRTITASQFGSQYDSVSVKATLGELSDTETIHKLTKGADGTDGTDGKNGTDGAPGPKGIDGRTSYVHVAYANSADGTNGFSTTDSNGKAYIGVYTDFTVADSNTPSMYTWSLFKGQDGQDGEDGIQGPKGADGISTYVHFAYANSSDGTSGFSTTDTTGKSYVGTLTDTVVTDSTDHTKYTWSLIKGADGKNGSDGAPGPKGTDGKTSYVHVAYANSSDGSSNFSVTDPTGRAYVGVYTDFTVADSNTPSVYTWSLIKGSDGKNGSDGAPGAPGSDGKTTYVHIAYANSADGKIDFSTSDNSGKKYIGVLTDEVENDSTDYTQYTWSLFKGQDGADGADGTPGKPGVDGKTTYVHFAYANSADGKTDFSVTDYSNKKFIGTLTDYTVADSTDYTKYTWSLIKGADGKDGANGLPGPKGADGRTSYIHFAYANSADGTNNFSTTDPTGRAYVGTLTDYTVADSTDYTKYTWSLIKGADGKNGTDGAPGPKGADGRTSYIHIAYANSSDGTNGFSTTDAAGKSYVGVYTDFTLADSTTPSVYTWSLIKGADGAQGIPGKPGADGRTPYLHTAWTNMTLVATENNSFTLSKNAIVRFGLDDNWIYKTFDAGTYTASSSTFGGDPYHGMGKVAEVVSDFSVDQSANKAYLGTYTDFTVADSTNPADYTWSLIKGSDGAQGIPGPKGADGISTYVHFAYANSSDGRNSFSVTDPTGRAYVGTLTDTVVADSTDPTKYTWSLIKGADGRNGSDGKNGTNSYSGWLTNESITLQADSNGNVPSFTSATGSFIVYNGLTQVTGLTITQANASGITVSLSGMNYSVTGMSADTGYVDLSVTTSGITIIKRLTVAKSKAGATGANGTSVVNSTTPPRNPAEGQWWNDLSVTPNILKVYQKGSWIPYRIDAINLVAGSVKADNLAADVLLASRVKYTNSNGTTTNLQTFDFDGIKTLLTDTHGNTYSSMDNAVSSTQSWTSLSKQVNDLGQINQLFNTEFSPDFAGWYSRGSSISVGTKATLGTPFNGSNTFAKVDATTTRLQSAPIAVIPGTKISYSVQKLSSSKIWSYINNVDVDGNVVNVPGTSSPEFGAIESLGYTKIENITIPSGVVYISFGFYLGGIPNGNVFSQPMLVFSQTVGAYVQGNYNNNDRVLKIEKSADDFQISIGQSVKDAQSSADSANTKVDNLSVGGRNYVLNSDVSTTSNITNFKTSIPVSNFSGKIITVSVQVDYDNITELPSSSIFNRIMFEPAAKDGKTGNTRYFGTSITPQIGDSFHGRISATYDLTNVNIIGFYTGENVNTWGQGIYVQGVVGTNVSVSRPKIEIGNKATDWTPAPEDQSAEITTKLKLATDSYTLGIDSNGNLISGIAGNTKSVTIKGNAITLDGNVNVTSDFYAKGGNFKNINAANIVGTNASFFQANFVNAYGHSVDISGDGMTVYYSDRFTEFNGNGVIFKQLVNYANGTSGLETVGGLVTSYKGTANMMMTTVYDQTYKNIGSPSGYGEIWGGDMIGWSRASDHNGNYDSLFTWSNGTAASVLGTSFGFNFYDRINFNQNEIVSGGNFNFLMSSTKFGSGYFGGKSVPSISATWSGNTGGGIAFGNDNVIIYAPGKTKIIL